MLVFLLSALVGWSALSLAVRLRLDGVAETLVAATVLASAFVLAPIYALGQLDALTHGSVAAGALGLSLVAWLGSSRRVGFARQAGATGLTLLQIVRAPFEALLEAWTSRSAVLPALLFAFLLFVWCGLAAWLAPSWREWDALWYHEPIIGFTIQNHGFAPVDLPSGGIQKINGYPRASEMLSLWFALYSGRALIDLPNVLLMPAFFASVYAMCRRLTGLRLAAAGWAAVACTVPAYVELLQSVYVDPAVATFVAAGALFVLRSPPRSREALVGAAALAIAANAKVSGVFAVVPLAALAVAYQLGAGRPGGRAALTIAAGAALIVGMSAVTYLGNLDKYGNPVWPDLHLRVPSLGIDWPGNFEFGSVRSSTGTTGYVAKNIPLEQLFHELFLRPGKIQDPERKYLHMYGLGVVWVLIPVAVFVAGRVVGALASWWLTGIGRLERQKLLEVLSLLFAAGMTLVTSTNRATPRYHLGTIALWVPVVAWTFARRRALQEALALAATLGGVAIVAWEMPDWRSFPMRDRLGALWRLSPQLRELTPELGAPVLREAGLARERELTAGTTVVSDDFVFPALLWNDDYSNKVIYVRRGTSLVAAAERVHATWIYAEDKPSADRVRAAGGWSEVGPLYVERWGVAFRRASR